MQLEHSFNLKKEICLPLATTINRVLRLAQSISSEAVRWPGKLRLLTGATALAASLASASPDALVDGVPLTRGGLNNCGLMALHELAMALQGATAETTIIDAASVPAKGFSMTELLDLSAKAGLDLAAVRRQADGPIPIPSIVHWKHGHYTAIVERRGDWYRLADPSFGKRWISARAIRAQSSGNFLVSSEKVPPNWLRLSPAISDTIIGGDPCDEPCGYDLYDCGSDCCTSGGGSGDGGGDGFDACDRLFLRLHGSLECFRALH